ncbi:hypothetical protein NXS19_012081 [Fusarium pseudograminearum]|nr:hypothetical protein NXS19_012081 [Fusarium pseudograminearum]
MAALAKNISVLLGGRTLQGLGSGGILALTYVIATDLVSLRDILGPLIGGALVEVSWPLLFWINLPFCGVAYIMISITMRIKRKEDASVNTKIKEFDWIGTIIFVASLTSFLIPLSWVGIMYDWSSPRTVVPLVFGILGLIAFGVHIKFCRRYSRCDPLIRPSLFTSLTALSAYFATIIHGIIVWCLVYYVPLYHEIRGSSPITAGVAVLPFTGTVALAAVVVGLLIAKTGTYRPFIWAGWTLVPLGMGLMMLLEKDTETYKWVLIYLQGDSVWAFSTQPRPLLLRPLLLIPIFHLLPGIGVAVGGVTFQKEFRKQIEKSTEFVLKADEWAKDASALVQIVKKSAASMQLMRDTIIDGYIKA